jgi:sarcosine oxidase
VREHAVPVEHLTHAEAQKRFPQFALPVDYEVIFEPDAGFLTPERSILVYVQQAIQLGAVIRAKEKVSQWKKVGTEIQVQTNKETYACKKLIICAGPWAGKLLPDMERQLSVSRQLIAWVNPKDQRAFSIGNFPCWLMDDHTVNGMYYGFPVLPVGKFGGPIGLKVALHYPGIQSQPDAVDRNITGEEEKELVKAIQRILPNGYESTFTMKTCLYTNTPDENFVLDYVPGYEKDVVVAAGFSGHGFKFSSVVGEIMADLAVNGRTDLPIGFLNATRLLNKQSHS